MSKRITRDQYCKNLMKNMHFHTEMYYIYSDIVNNRNLSPIEFFKYLRDNYESIDYIKSMIKKMEKDGLIVCANNIKTIMTYKEAILMHNKKLEKELEPKFKKIKYAKKVLKKNDIRYELLQRERNNKKQSNINLEIENYLNEDKVYDETEYEKLRYKISRRIKDVENEKYIMFINKKYDIQSIDMKEIDELIETLEFFIRNLKNNLWKFEIYFYIIRSREKEYERLNSLKNKLRVKEKIDKLESIIDLYSKMAQTELQDIKVDCNIPILLICSSKITAMRNMLQGYSKLLNKLIDFKDKTSDIKGKLPKAKIEDEFILKMIDEINILLTGYYSIYGSSYKKVNEIKEDYLKKYVYDSRKE